MSYFMSYFMSLAWKGKMLFFVDARFVLPKLSSLYRCVSVRRQIGAETALSLTEPACLRAVIRTANVASEGRGLRWVCVDGGEIRAYCKLSKIICTINLPAGRDCQFMSKLSNVPPPTPIARGFLSLDEAGRPALSLVCQLQRRQ